MPIKELVSLTMAIFGILMLFCVGSSLGPVYRHVKVATIKRVYRGLEPLSGFTNRLTASKSKY